MKKIKFLLALCILALSVTAQNAHQTRNVILVTIDGFRWQEVFRGADSSFIRNKRLVEHTADLEKKFWRDDVNERRAQLLPFLWGTVAKNGQIYGNRDKNCFVNVKNPYWFSYPGYNEILTGYADTKVNSNEFGPNPNESLFEAMNKTRDFKGRIAAFTSWDAFNDILNEKRSDLTVNSGYERCNNLSSNNRMQVLNELQYQLPDIFHGVRLDGVTFQMGFEYLKTKRPRVLYLAFDETDDFAHGGRYEDYLNSARYTDQFLATLWEWIQSQPEYKNKTTLLITCDHGRGEGPTEWRDHGTKAKGSDQTWFAVMGPDTKAMGEMTEGQYFNNQYANTLADLLDFKYKSDKLIGETIRQVVSVSEYASR